MPPRTGHNVASPARLVHSTPAPVLSKRSPADTAPDPRGAGENYDPEYYTTPKTPDAPILQETSRGIVAPIAGRSGEFFEIRVNPNLVRRCLHVLGQHEPRPADASIADVARRIAVHQVPPLKEGDYYALVGDPWFGLPTAFDKQVLWYGLWLLHRKNRKVHNHNDTIYIPSVRHALRELGLPAAGYYFPLFKEALWKWAGVRLYFNEQALHRTAFDMTKKPAHWRGPHYERSWDGKHHLVIPVFAYAGTEEAARGRGELADIRHYHTRDTGFFVRFSRTFLWAILDEHYQYQFELGWYLKLRDPLAARLYEFFSPLIGYRLTDKEDAFAQPQTFPFHYLRAACGVGDFYTHRLGTFKKRIDKALQEVAKRTHNRLVVECKWGPSTEKDGQLLVFRPANRACFEPKWKNKVVSILDSLPTD